MSDWKETCAKCRDGEIEPRLCEYYGEPNGCNSPIYGEHPKSMPAGNAAEMREALVRLRDIALAALEKRSEGVDTVNLAEAILHHSEKALAAPARQCDVGTAEEQIKRFTDFCEEHYNLHYNEPECGNCPLWTSGRCGSDCQLKWAQAPYAEEGGAK